MSFRIQIQLQKCFDSTVPQLPHESTCIMIPMSLSQVSGKKKSELVDQGNRNQEKSNYSFLSLLHCTLMCDQLWSFNTK